MSIAVWDRLRSELAAVHKATAALEGFSPFPDDITPQDVTPHAIPASALLSAEPDLVSGPYPGLCKAFIAAAPYAQWRETYKGTDIGQDFLDRFGCYCLIGDGGAFASDTLSAYVVYMPAGLHYPFHQHPAEEIYLVLAGQAEFHRAGLPSETLLPGQSSFHASNQPHAMTTHDHPVMALVLWRNGFETRPVLS